MSLFELWSAARERLAWLYALFGTPIAFIAEREGVTRGERAEVFAFLRPLERLVRCLVIAEALALNAPAPQHRPVRKRAPIAPRWPGADSAAWPGVRFTVLPRVLPPASPRPRAPPRTCFPRYPIARRIEALARIIADPRRAVRRCAAAIRTRINASRPRLDRLTAPADDPHHAAIVRLIVAALAREGAPLPATRRLE